MTLRFSDALETTKARDDADDADDENAGAADADAALAAAAMAAAHAAAAALPLGLDTKVVEMTWRVRISRVEPLARHRRTLPLGSRCC
jgi:hypothetical protein